MTREQGPGPEEISNPTGELEAKKEKISESSKKPQAETQDDSEELKMTPEKAVQIAEQHYKKLEEDLRNADTVIAQVESMERGSREKYDAAFKMRDQVEGIFFASETAKTVLESSPIAVKIPRREIKGQMGNVEAYALTNIHSPEVAAAQQRLEELKTQHEKTLRRMMEVWQEAKKEYEGK